LAAISSRLIGHNPVLSSYVCAKETTPPINKRLGGSNPRHLIA
jgi:hypothetical protein